MAMTIQQWHRYVNGSAKNEVCSQLSPEENNSKWDKTLRCPPCSYRWLQLKCFSSDPRTCKWSRPHEKKSCHHHHPWISKSVLSKVEIRVLLWNAKATLCPQLPSLWLELAPFKNEHPKFVWWRWLISRMESKARLTMRDISFEQTQSSITDQQSQRHVKGFRKHLSLGIMSCY